MRHLATAALLALLGAAPSVTTAHIGLCEASALAFLDRDTFVVASDEVNILQRYRRGRAAPLSAIDLTAFSTFDKSDLEGAAVIGDRVYLMSSHSLNSHDEDKAKRRVLIATMIVPGPDGPTLRPVSRPSLNLRDPIVAAAGGAVRRESLNIEAIAAAPDGGLLIGLRAPLEGANAIIVTLLNPADVVDGRPPRFGRRYALPLGGLGIRDMTRLDDGGYLIAAGHVEDADDGFALYAWSGTGERATLRRQVPFRVEGVAQIPGTRRAMLVSDDGASCSDENTPPAERRFRVMEVPL